MPAGASLQIRRKADGSVHIVGELPVTHGFNARHIARELEHPFGSMFEVFVVLRTANLGDAVYRLTGFGELDPDNADDDRLNLNNWEVERVSDDEPILEAIEQVTEEETSDG